MYVCTEGIVSARRSIRIVAATHHAPYADLVGERCGMRAVHCDGGDWPGVAGERVFDVLAVERPDLGRAVLRPRENRRPGALHAEDRRRVPDKLLAHQPRRAVPHPHIPPHCRNHVLQHPSKAC
jgi:hypothetical protein